MVEDGKRRYSLQKKVTAETSPLAPRGGRRRQSTRLMAGLLGRKTSGDANVQGSTAWLLRLKNTLENSQKDMSLVPTSNVVALDPEVLKNDVRRLERRLKNMQLFLLDPKSKKMQHWDFVILFAMVFTATVSPYEVCLIWDVEKFGPLFYVNLVINLIFVNDTIMQFFLPYRESILQGGSMVKNHKRIALHYIETWFFLDLASIIPFDYITMGIALDESNVSLLGATSLLRLMRLIKLVRILRASRIFSRWENSISMKYSQRDLMSLLFLVAFTLHLFSCLLGMAGQLMKARRNQEFLNIVESQIHQNTSCYGCIYNNPQFERYCFTGCFTPCELDIKLSIEMPDAIGLEADRYLDFLKSQESWICRRNQRGEIGDMPDAAFEVYVAGLYVALLQMGGGVGNIVPQNLVENVIFFIMIWIGSVMWALVVGSICAMSATGNPFSVAFKHRMDSLNYFLEDMGMEMGLRHRAREYLRLSKDLGKKAAYNSLVDGLSPEVRKDIVLKMSAKTLECVWFLRRVEDSALVELSQRLQREGFSPRERLHTGKLTILMRGVSAKGGVIMTNTGSGSNLPHWGEDIILNSPALRDRKPAAALTYVEIITLSRPDLDEVLEDFPIANKEVRRAAVYMGVRRSMVTVADYVKDHFGDDFAMGASTPDASEPPSLSRRDACTKGILSSVSRSFGAASTSPIVATIQEHQRMINLLTQEMDKLAVKLADKG